MRSKNRKLRPKTNPATKADLESFRGYRVIVKGFGQLSIFAASTKAAELVARRILGETGRPYDGSLEMRREEKTGHLK